MRKNRDKKPILEAKRPILEAKMPGIILDEDFGARTAECARPIAKLESSGYSWSTEQFHTPAILADAADSIAPRIPPSPPSVLVAE